ncbi:putative polypeptide N-acetylgalactosaminyltransferase 9 [Anopheles aquasalis]|uniref:putative polypeptide N-acetylgalactosaminyltransferase 9 n=1 Tax=Anopheles aquasalis TaxID=42839 RepID=UPI00215B28FB|nr:putative polypeptide N-acetylgalactosaminyltransferase 9 [Anopheles aquasalis]
MLSRSSYLRCWALMIGALITLFLVDLLLYQNSVRVMHRIRDWNVTPLNSTKQKLDYSSLPGHMGTGVQLDPSSAVFVKESVQRYGFNEYASSLIPVRRILPDMRANLSCCRPRRETLPQTSIVIVFHNEAWSALLRTVHSVLDHSPAELVDEVVLVDDCSYLPHLKAQLEEYFRPFAKIRIIRASTRLGLINARILGAKNTSAPLLTFLDAHVECTVGWLEPLLEQVARNDTTIAVPLIDRIDDHDLHVIVNVSSHLIGAFEWDLNFGWWYREMFPRRTATQQLPSAPFETPAMAGGLFTIDRSFFARLGWYDEQFRVYGMENAELSIKSWMCGGRIVAVPCSHVAHIRKSAHPYIGQQHQNVTLVNSVRLAEVWMDEYKRIVFDVNGIPGYSEQVFGSVSGRQEVRKHAECKSFQYYLQRAYPEMPSPIVTGQFRGEVHNAALGNGTCLTVSRGARSPTMEPCLAKNSPSQFWTHNFYQELNSYKRCIDATSSPTGPLLIALCHRMRRNQAWSYSVSSLQLRSVAHQTCLSIGTDTVSNITRTVTLEPCQEHKLAQQWYVPLFQYDFWKQP